MSCLKYDNVMALYRFYIAFSYQQFKLTHSCGYKPADVKNAAKNLAAKIGVDIDLHTINGAAWSNGKETDYINAFNVEPRRATGAGDCWNAADIVGHLAGLDPRERLTLLTHMHHHMFEIFMQNRQQ